MLKSLSRNLNKLRALSFCKMCISSLGNWNPTGFVFFLSLCCSSPFSQHQSCFTNYKTSLKLCSSVFLKILTFNFGTNFGSNTEPSDPYPLCFLIVIEKKSKHRWPKTVVSLEANIPVSFEVITPLAILFTILGQELFLDRLENYLDRVFRGKKARIKQYWKGPSFCLFF